MKLTPAQQRRQIVATEKEYSTEAFRDGRDALVSAHEDFKNGNRLLGDWHEQEAEKDSFWGHKRLGIVRRNER